jgi:uncharacterized membrane protein YfcA
MARDIAFQVTWVEIKVWLTWLLAIVACICWGWWTVREFPRPTLYAVASLTLVSVLFIMVAVVRTSKILQD